MKELYYVMEELLENEYELNGLKRVMCVMKSGFKLQENQEMEEIISVIELYLGKVSEDMRKSISHLDEWIIENIRK